MHEGQWQYQLAVVAELVTNPDYVIDSAVSPILADAMERGAGRITCEVLTRRYLRLSTLVDRHDGAHQGASEGASDAGGFWPPVPGAAVACTR